MVLACSSKSAGPEDVKDSLVPKDASDLQETVDTGGASADAVREVGSDLDSQNEESSSPTDALDLSDIPVDVLGDVHGGDSLDSASDQDVPLDAPGDAAVDDGCPHYATAKVVGWLTSEDVTEASGLGASIRNPGILWVHNDSGDTARFFALDSQGHFLGQFLLDGVVAEDWEDLTVGPGPDPEKSYLYLGDVGDNLANRPFVSIVRIPEPEVPDSIPFSVVLSGAESFAVTYPDGQARNCEAIAMDPVDGTLYLVDKTTDVTSTLFSVVLPAEVPEQPLAMEMVMADFPVGIATAADFSPEGSVFIVRSYWEAFAWVRAETPEGLEMMGTVVHKTPCKVPIAFDGLGETVAFSRDDTGYFSLSEGMGQPFLLLRDLARMTVLSRIHQR